MLRARRSGTSARRALAPGQSLEWSTAITSDVGAGWYWLHGTYYLGCKVGEEVGSGTCTAGPEDRYVRIDVKAK